MPAKTPEQFTVTMFSYERDFTQIFEALNRFQKKHQKKNLDFQKDIEEKDLHFDIEVKEEDDFDH